MTIVPLPHASGIYRITCIPTNKIYIGSAYDLRRRWSEHAYELRAGRHCNQRLQHAWNKYGADAFVFEVLELAPREQLLIREQYYLDTLRPYDRAIGLNIATDAVAPMRGRTQEPISDETRAKLQKAARARGPVTEETRAKLREAWKHRLPDSAETRAKKVKALEDCRYTPRPPVTEKTRARLSAAGRGRKHSMKARQRAAAARRKYWAARRLAEHEAQGQLPLWIIDEEGEF